MSIDKNKIYILLCSVIGATLTWYMNHKIGYGAIVSNGLIGVIAAILLPADLAGVTYTASFVGMSSLAILPSILAVLLGGLVIGIIIIFTKEIYSGVGGKGGTTAAAATLITKTIVGFFS